MKPFKNFDKLEMGIDEAGRGCLFGRVYVGGVILPYDFQERLDEEFNKKLQLRDSKKVNEKDRKLLRKLIEERAIDYIVCYAEHYEVDEFNILQTTLNTMHECVNQIKIKPNFLLVDGDKFIPYKGIEHECVKGGDNTYHSIAGASILAKEYRD